MDKDLLDDAQEEFKLSVEAEQDQRKVSEEDLRFGLLEDQWPETVVKQRELEGRPCLTINRLPAFTKQVTNEARQSPPSIVTKPVGDGADKETAGILNDLLRNIETASQSDIVYGTALDFAVHCGFGYFRVNVDYSCEDSFDQDISLERISNPFSVYGDENSTEATSKDWNKCFVTDLYTPSAFKKKWKGAEASSFQADQATESQALWFVDKKIRVAEYWTREEVQEKLLMLTDGSVMREPEWLKAQDLFLAQGIEVKSERDTKGYKVKQRIISGVDVLEENDWLGRYIPIIPMYGEEVNVNGKRHFISLIRRAKDSQRMFNFWRTASTEAVSLAIKAPYIGPKGAFDSDGQRWSTSNTTNYAYLEYDPVPGQPPPTRVPFAGVPTGMMQESVNAEQDMKSIMGLHEASLGERGNETSGRAIIARQKEGDVSTYNFIDNRNRAVEHGGRVVVDLIPKVYTVERIMRCIREDGTVYNVPVNQEVVPKSAIPPQPGQEADQGQQSQPEYVALAGLPPEQQERLKGLAKVFDLTAGKYDVVVSAGPSFTNKREESAVQMMEFLRAFPQAAPLIGDILAKTLDWPGAEEIATRLRAMLPPQAHGKIDPIVQQLQQQLQQQDQMAKDAVGQLSEQIKALQQELKDKSIENQQKEAELRMKGRELEIKEQDAKVKNIATLAQVGIVDEAVIASLGAKKPVRKRARAVRQPDNSFVLESIEEVVE